LAIYDKGIRSSLEDKEKEEMDHQPKQWKEGSSNLGFAIDAPEEGEAGEDEDDDELVLAALDSMDAIDAFKHGEQTNVHHSIIPTDNFLKLVELLLLIAPIDAQQSVSSLAPDLSDKRVAELRQAANVILSSFGVDNHPGVTYRTFNTVVSTSLPYLFNGLNPLFEHFLFAKDFDLSKRKSGPGSPTQESKPVIPPPKAELEPVLREPGEILNLTTLSQLSFFIKGSDLFRRLRPLYSGNTHGFSMGSFEKQVFNWRAPTILLVKGRLLPATPSSTRERALQDMLPPKRLPDSVTSTSPNQTLIYGAYISSQWKHTGKTCFGDSSTELFQLSPTHDVFTASTFSKDYTYFSKSPTYPAGVGLGTLSPHNQLPRRSFLTLPSVLARFPCILTMRLSLVSSRIFPRVAAPSIQASNLEGRRRIGRIASRLRVWRFGAVVGTRLQNNKGKSGRGRSARRRLDGGSILGLETQKWIESC
jgi:hypothetical protein